MTTTTAATAVNRTLTSYPTASSVMRTAHRVWCEAPMGNFGPLGSSAHVTQIDPLAVSLWLNEMKSFFKTTDKKFYKIGCGPSHFVTFF